MRRPKNKGANPYDANGRWVEERGQIKGAIRRVFRLSPQMEEVLQAARVELPPKIKKDGEPGKKNQVRYTCAICQKLYQRTNVQVDHIDPVVPLWKAEASMTYDEIARRVFCHVSNLQVICSTPMKKNNGEPSCHKIKTDRENFIRDELKKVMNLLDHTGEEIDELIKQASAKYDVYFAEKEEKRKAKLARKKRLQNL